MRSKGRKKYRDTNKLVGQKQSKDHEGIKLNKKENTKNEAEGEREVHIEKSAGSIEIFSVTPYLEQICNLYFPWISPRLMIEYYGRMVNSFAESATAVSNLTNDLTMVNIDSIEQMTKTTIGHCMTSTPKTSAVSSI
jgi:uncharacterized secreted protein with C-terminal beta-propeller domain